MAKKIVNKEKGTQKKKKGFLESNWILRVTLAIIAIPIVIIAFMLLTSVESSGEPVVGNRFENQLNPAIKDSQVKQIKDSIVYEGMDGVEVNLKSATLRISVDVNNASDQAIIEEIANNVYGKVDSVLPIATYFTNQGKTKMYDLEINVFNFIPDENNPGEKIHAVLHKNASAEAAALDWKSTPKNEDVSNTLLNPGV